MTTLPEKYKNICIDCVGDPFLKHIIEKSSSGSGCDYCETGCISASLEELVPHIEFAFKEYFERTADEPDGYELAADKDIESSYYWSRDGEPTYVVIAEAAEISEVAAMDLQEMLFDKHGDYFETEEQEFDPEAHYVERRSIDITDLNMSWGKLEEIVKRRNRFFSKDVRNILGNIFNDIDNLSENIDLVIKIGPQTEFENVYRARYVYGEELDKVLERPEIHLGPPPAHLAMAGRMNAHGIAMFYGAENSYTAITEVRPPVGGFVVSGKFTFKRQLKVLDLHAAIKGRDYITSRFDPKDVLKIKKLKFLKNLSQRMSQPVSPHDTRLAYIATQVIADYLSAENTPALDGIIFPSSQTGGETRNIVLFHHASRVAPIDYPRGTEIKSESMHYNGDEYEKEFTVFEIKPHEDLSQTKPSRSSFHPLEYTPLDDDRALTLSINPEDLEVFQVESISYKCDQWGYMRHTL